MFKIFLYSSVTRCVVKCFVWVPIIPRVSEGTWCGLRSRPADYSSPGSLDFFSSSELTSTWSLNFSANPLEVRFRSLMIVGGCGMVDGTGWLSRSPVLCFSASLNSWSELGLYLRWLIVRVSRRSTRLALDTLLVFVAGGSFSLVRASSLATRLGWSSCIDFVVRREKVLLYTEFV